MFQNLQSSHMQQAVDRLQKITFHKFIEQLLTWQMQVQVQIFATDVLNLYTLHSALLRESYVLSHQALYHRLVSRSPDSNEGKRHVRTVPVKIRKTQNNLRNRYKDANFYFANKQCMKDIASLFAAENLFVLSVGDKEKVTIEVTAATKQYSLVIHVIMKLA